MKWGVLATGSIANDFTLALKNTQEAVLYAVASRSQESADAFGDKHGFQHKYPTYDALLADAEVEIVYVATPHTWHCELILQCLEAGKHVLCEKPMCCSGSQAQRCIDKAAEKKLFLMEGMWTRFFPATRAIRKAIADGEIGPIVSMTASFGFKGEDDFNARLYKPELAGGALFDVGIYPAMFISMVLGTPQKVSAHAKMTAEGVDAQTFVTFEYEKVVAQLQCDLAIIITDSNSNSMTETTQTTVNIKLPQQ